MKCVHFLILIILLIHASGVRGETTFRISGVVGQEGRWLFAVIEDSKGSCRIYGKGDTLDQGVIVDVTPEGVLVDIAGSNKLLKLEGSAFIAKTIKTEASSSVVPAGSSNLVEGKLPLDELKIAVATMANELAKDRKKPFDSQVLNAVLNLPSQARITAVNNRPVTTARDSAMVLTEALKQNIPPRVTFTEDNETREVYIMPPPSGPPNTE
jgi:hypothetical protein